MIFMIRSGLDLYAESQIREMLIAFHAVPHADARGDYKYHISRY